MAALEGEVLTDTQQTLKSAIRGKIFSQSELMRDNLVDGVEFIHSKQHPTQVLEVKGQKYIRINEADIHEDTIDHLLGVMLGFNKMKIEEEDEDVQEQIQAILEESIKKNIDQDGEDVFESEMFNKDEYENLVLEDIPLQPQMVRAKAADEKKEEEKNEEELQDDADSCDMTSDAQEMQQMMDGEDNPGDGEEKEQKAMSYEAVKDLEQSLQELEHKGNHASKFHQNYSILSLDELKQLHKKVPMLLKAFRGHGGKIKKIAPSKRISAKAMAADKDKVYWQKKADQGKHIKLNFLIDMSGSMGGYPVKNAVSIVWLFNQLAKAGYLQMSVLYSTTNDSYKLSLPAPDSEVLALSRVRSSEGLAETVRKYQNDIKNTNLICLTDGDICDEPIKKQFWAKNRIVSTGVYVNPAAKDVTHYSGNLNKWFDHSVVRETLDDLIEWLIKTGLKG